MMLSDYDKCLLIRLARKRITENLVPEKQPDIPRIRMPEPLTIKCGVFVSLYVGDDLRGCIGTFSENDPLHKSVERMALSAATTDLRFRPLMAKELEDLKIEISVLSPRVRISGPEEIVLGKHGIYMQLGSNRGTFLPQVAINQNWNVEQFLGNCAKHKAGIGWYGWKQADLYTYEAIVFNSAEISSEC